METHEKTTLIAPLDDCDVVYEQKPEADLPGELVYTLCFSYTHLYTISGSIEVIQ